MIDPRSPQVPPTAHPGPAAWPRRSSGRSRAVRPGRAHLSRRARRHGGAHRRFGPFTVSSRSGRDRLRQGGDAKPSATPGVRNGANLLGASDPRDRPRRRRPHPLDPTPRVGNAAIAAVANDEQKRRYAGRWAAMAITEFDTGSDSAPSARPPSGTVTTCSTAKRSSSPRASAPSWSSCGRRWTEAWASRRSSPSSSSGPTRACDWCVRAQTRHSVPGHGRIRARGLPGACRGPARRRGGPVRRRRLRRRDADLRQHPTARRGDGAGPDQSLSRHHA